MKSKSFERAKRVEKIVRLSWDSLQSHLYWTHTKSSEGTKFHKQAILQYVEIIEEATKLW